MSDLARFANRFRFLAVLRALLALSAGSAALVALLLLAAPALLDDLLGAPAAAPSPVAARLLAVTLLILAVLAYEALRDPRRYSGIVRAAIAGHLLAGIVLAAAALWLTAGLNAALGLALAGTWWPLRS